MLVVRVQPAGTVKLMAPVQVTGTCSVGAGISCSEFGD